MLHLSNSNKGTGIDSLPPGAVRDGSNRLTVRNEGFAASILFMDVYFR